jgi:glycosyltransferase involved in cell wall biosynthesis
MYRGDKDLRLGIELCKSYNVNYTLLVPDIASLIDRKFFKTKRFPKKQLPHLPKGMDIKYIKSIIVHFNRQNVNIGGTYFQISFQYRKLIKKLNPDIIFESPYTTLTPRSYMTYMTAKNLRKPIIYVDAGDVPSKGRVRKIINKLEGNVIRYASQIIVYNNYGKNRFINEYKYPEHKIAVIPKPIDIQIFNPGIGRNEIRDKLNIGDRFVVSYAGRLSNNKGCYHLLNAANQLKNQGREKDYFFLFIGGNIDDEEADTINILRKKYALKNVYFTGRISHSEMNKYQAASDLMVYPDVTNPPGFPTVLAESMAMGKAIIIGCKGYEEATPLKDDYNGTIIEAGNVQDLIKVISDLRKNDSKRQLYGSRVREFALSNMDWRVVASKYFKIFKEGIESMK